MKLHLTLEPEHLWTFGGATYFVPEEEAQAIITATGRRWVESRSWVSTAYESLSRGTGLPYLRPFVRVSYGEVVEYGFVRSRRYAPGCTCEHPEGYADPDRPACTCELDPAPVLELTTCELRERVLWPTSYALPAPPSPDEFQAQYEVMPTF